MARRSLIRRFLITAAALVVLYGVVHLVMRQVSTGPLRARIEEKLTQALGLEVSLDALRVALLPTPHLHAEGVRVTNFPNRSAPNLLSIGRLDLGLALWPLLRRTVVVDALTIEGADLHLETDEEGRLASDHRLGAPVKDDEEESLELELRQLDVETLRVFYRDARAGTSYSLVLDSVAVKSKALGSNISLEARGEARRRRTSFASRTRTPMASPQAEMIH